MYRGLISNNGQNARGVTGLERELLQLFHPLFQGDLAIFNEGLESVVPRINVTEGEKEFRVSAELPGVDEKDIRVNVTKEGLSISGEKKQEAEEKDKNFYRLERSYATFQRLLPLPDAVDHSKAEASFKKGVLTVVLPKRADAAPKTVNIKSE